MQSQTKKRTLYQVLGTNLRRLRGSNEWSQDEVANLARSVGLDWSRSSVAAVEAGKKTLDVTELVLLSLAVGSGLKELLSGKGQVAISETTDMALRDVRGILADDDPPPAVVMKVRRRLAREKGVYLGEDVDLLIEEDEAERQLAIEQASKGEAEQKAARKFHVPVDVLADCALEVWGRSLTKERDLRIRQMKRQPTSIRNQQALRGHVTRQLLGDLTEIIGEYKQRIYDEETSS